MAEFPRTTVGGVSLPRLIAGTNWFLGYSHTSLAKDKFIREYQTRRAYRRDPDRVLGARSRCCDGPAVAAAGRGNP